MCTFIKSVDFIKIISQLSGKVNPYKQENSSFYKFTNVHLLKKGNGYSDEFNGLYTVGAIDYT